MTSSSRRSRSWERNAGFWIRIIGERLDPFRTEVTDGAVLRAVGPCRGRGRPRQRPVLHHPTAGAALQRLRLELTRLDGPVDAPAGGVVLVAGRHRVLCAAVMGAPSAVGRGGPTVVAGELPQAALRAP